MTAYGVAVPAAAEAGLLTGVYADTEAPVGSYVQKSIDGVVAMYQVAAGEQSIVNANQAYLTVADSKEKVFYFNEKDAGTGINDVKGNGETDDVIYNTLGQKVNKTKKGLYIINGKKVLK